MKNESCTKKIKHQQQGNLDLEEAHYCLEIEISHEENEEKIIFRRRLIKELKRFQIEDYKAVSTPVEPNVKLIKSETVSKQKMKKYSVQKLIGLLMYLTVASRPDIPFRQFNTNYEKESSLAAKRVLQYLKRTQNCEIVNSKSTKVVEGFADADFVQEHFVARVQKLNVIKINSPEFLLLL